MLSACESSCWRRPCQPSAIIATHIWRQDVLTFCRSPTAHRRVLKHPCSSMESASRPFGSHFRHFTGSNAKNGPLGLGLALACTYRGGPSLYLIPLLTSLPKLSTWSFISDVTGLATSTIKRKGLRHDVALPYRVSAKGKLAWQRLLAVVFSSL